jgi:hypothetical protein
MGKRQDLVSDPNACNARVSSRVMVEGARPSVKEICRAEQLFPFIIMITARSSAVSCS